MGMLTEENLTGWVGGRHGSPTYSYVAEPDKQKQVTHEKPIDS